MKTHHWKAINHKETNMYGQIYQSRVSGLFYSVVGTMTYITLRQVWHNADDDKFYVVKDGAITIPAEDLHNDFINTGLTVRTYHYNWR